MKQSNKNKELKACLARNSGRFSLHGLIRILAEKLFPKKVLQLANKHKFFPKLQALPLYWAEFVLLL